MRGQHGRGEDLNKKIRSSRTLKGATALLVVAVAGMSLASTAFAGDQGARGERYDVPTGAAGGYGVPTAAGATSPAEDRRGLSFSAFDVVLVLGGGLLLLGGAAMSVGLGTRLAAYRTSSVGRPRLEGRVARVALRR
jgi:hypothetical protein